MAFVACLAVSLTTDDPEGEFVALMMSIQLAAFLLLPAAVALSVCLTNQARRLVERRGGPPSWCPDFCSERILAEVEADRRRREDFEARRREQEYMRYVYT